MKRSAWIATFLLLLASSQLSAQWLGRLTLDNGYDDNAFSNAYARSTGMTSASLMYGYFPENGNWNVNYRGSYNSYIQYPERQYTNHYLGMSYIHAYGDKRKSSISFLASALGRFDRNEYEIYDYYQGLAMVSLKQSLSASAKGRAGYRARYRTYTNFNELSYLEHFLFIGGNAFFKTRTSVNVEVDFGYKNYMNHTYVQQEIPGTSTFAPATGLNLNGLTLDGGDGGDGGGGKGGGNGGDGGDGGNGGDGEGGDGDGGDGDGGDGDGGSGNGNGGDNGGNGNGDNSGEDNGGLGSEGQGYPGGQPGGFQYVKVNEPSASQVRAWINVGQSITDGTGVSVKYLQRWNPGNRGAAVSGGSVDFIGEEELFDDPYSYESSEITVRLTQLLPWSMQMQIAGYYYNKNYPYPYTLDYSTLGTENRQDVRKGAWLTMNKAFPGDWFMFNGVKLTLTYVYTVNSSNTDFYDYNSNYLSLRFSTDF